MKTLLLSIFLLVCFACNTNHKDATLHQNTIDKNVTATQKSSLNNLNEENHHTFAVVKRNDKAINNFQVSLGIDNKVVNTTLIYSDEVYFFRTLYANNKAATSALSVLENGAVVYKGITCTSICSKDATMCIPDKSKNFKACTPCNSGAGDCTKRLSEGGEQITMFQDFTLYTEGSENEEITYEILVKKYPLKAGYVVLPVSNSSYSEVNVF
ncbi:hypothetical protein GGR32_001120 [Mesonia hippocampi]|uniref:Uncharacterized protein n=1 Tax=Mesonia hippocampi TaxID=1628250 RepID=A0A840EKC6_9FLAO|nr:hypothetical protein [Mesonia hippocampi]MBB4118829.1 hypothetical protein [Mesonia hippocampi]